MRMREIAEPLIRERFFAGEVEDRMCRSCWRGVRRRRVDWAAMWRELERRWGEAVCW